MDWTHVRMDLQSFRYSFLTGVVIDRIVVNQRIRDRVIFWEAMSVQGLVEDSQRRPMAVGDKVLTAHFSGDSVV